MRRGVLWLLCALPLSACSWTASWMREGEGLNVVAFGRVVDENVLGRVNRFRGVKDFVVDEAEGRLRFGVSFRLERGSWSCGDAIPLRGPEARPTSGVGLHYGSFVGRHSSGRLSELEGCLSLNPGEELSSLRYVIVVERLAVVGDSGGKRLHEADNLRVVLYEVIGSERRELKYRAHHDCLLPEKRHIFPLRPLVHLACAPAYALAMVLDVPTGVGLALVFPVLGPYMLSGGHH